VDIYDISKALRHSNIRMTEMYLERLDSSATDRAIERVSNGENNNKGAAVESHNA